MRGSSSRAVTGSGVSGDESEGVSPVLIPSERKKAEGVWIVSCGSLGELGPVGSGTISRGGGAGGG